MDEKLVFRRARPADAARIMEIIRQAQAQMRALGSLQWQDGYPAAADIGHANLSNISIIFSFSPLPLVINLSNGISYNSII